MVLCCIGLAVGLPLQSTNIGFVQLLYHCITGDDNDCDHNFDEGYDEKKVMMTKMHCINSTIVYFNFQNAFPSLLNGESAENDDVVEKEAATEHKIIFTPFCFQPRLI